MFDQYTQIAELLDKGLEYLPIFGSNAVTHVYDRSWSLEMNSMKYTTTLRLRVSSKNDNYAFSPMDGIGDIGIMTKDSELFRSYLNRAGGKTNEERTD